MGTDEMHDLELLRDAAREVAERNERHGLPRGRFPGTIVSKTRFGAKPSGLHADNLSTKPAPGPKGPSAAELIEEARRRRRERAGEERGR